MICPALVISASPIDDIDALFGISTVNGREVVSTLVLRGRSLGRIMESVAPLSTMTGLRILLFGGVVGDDELRVLFMLLLSATVTGKVARLVFMPTPPRQAMRYPGVIVEFPPFPLILVGRVAHICSWV